ncbi:MAG: dTDP-4-dehydrorhamnose reductase [Bacteroidota bacterium]|nr:dTDP-4-dehydrorhamnose reductase [Bacteroidota bacterium]MDP4190969.1 dTDP-4-dehydrorhamnose reductase [Bacteroidota bacterium]MDP4195108.1 dTDP-4-dehydrorhamnose reductase [Bacteroidota bacterium]
MIHSHDLIKKRILVVGANGMLGQRIINFYKYHSNVELLAASLEEEPYDKDIPYIIMDISKRDSVKDVVYDFFPDIIINAAAYTNVDKCEKEREIAWKINVKGPEHLAETARIIDAHLIHISTDYVFDGRTGPYSEDEKPRPVGYYGRTKLASENALRLIGPVNTIIRTNVLYGPVKNGRPDFVRWVIDSLRNNQQINIVTDQINNPTFLDDLVQGIYRIIEQKKQGIFNIGGLEFLSRFDFTLKIADFFGLDKSLIKPIKTCELNQLAPRPLNSGLITLKAETQLGYKPHTIKDTFIQMKKELKL